jgi:hypothetical protein
VSRLIGAPPGYVGFDQAGSSPTALTNIRIACCSLTKSIVLGFCPHLNNSAEVNAIA